MGKTVKLTAFLVATQLDVKGIKSFLEIKPLEDSSSELFYKFEEDKYQYFVNYGVIVFSGYSEDEMNRTIKRTVQAYHRNPVLPWLRDDFNIRIEDRTDILFEFDEAVIGRIDNKVIRIAMLNLAQSVALDYYHDVSDTLLTEIKGFARELELTGKLKISRKNMMRFIGKALNTQNDIAENIYIFDAPELVWEDEYLDKLHQASIKHFDLRVRFSEVEYTLRIIEDNLTVFREISNQRESNLLEWIIILLILVEVFNLMIMKFFD